jgi:hypothetical protein
MDLLGWAVTDLSREQKSLSLRQDSDEILMQFDTVDNLLSWKG